MASITREPNGRKTIQFIAPDRRRRSIRLGKYAMRSAETVRVHVEAILSSINSRSPLESKTADWLGEIGEDLHAKLAAVHLVEPRQTTASLAIRTLKGLLVAFDGDKLKAKESTRVSWGHTRRNLLEFFGESKDIVTVSEADADKWAEWLDAEQELSAPTIRKRCGNAKQFFRFAVKKRLIPANPFGGLKSGNLTNRSRDHFVSRDDAQLVLDACPDAEWRLLFALSRFGGLRCPSEHFALRWADIDWQRSRIRVHSPKTEHHQGGESRLIPIFPELLPYLREAYELAPEGAEYVITRYRSADKNLRTQLERIIKRAGLEPWPKLFHNLRATRQTELEETFPSHVVCAWIGNSEKVARQHYLQTTEEHFERAVQNTVHHPSTHDHAEPHEKTGDVEDSRNMVADVALCGAACGENMGDAGLEPATSWV